MRRANLFTTVASLRVVVAVLFFNASISVPGVRAQPAGSSEPSAGASLLVTNILQLTKLLDSSPRVIADIRLDVIVCSQSRPEMGVLVVSDKTGSELLELGPRSVSLASGDIVHIEDQHCLFRRREMGVEITRAPDIANDGAHGLRRVAAEVNLAAGLHPFQLDYFNFQGPFGLELRCRLPDGSTQSAGRFFVRSNGAGASGLKMVPGLDATFYEGSWLNVPDFALLPPVGTATVTNLNPIVAPTRDLLGIRFSGFFSAPSDGVYRFDLASDDGSLLFLSTPEVPLIKARHEKVPAPMVSSLHAPMADFEAPKWMSVEGRATFVSRSGRGLRFELRSQPDSIWVLVADAKGVDPQRLLNSRIRIAGIGRAAMAPNRECVLGDLSVATADDITILEDSGAAMDSSVATPVLAAVGQIQSLSKEEASRRLPVRIRGVVTSLAPSIFRFMSIQDETRGIFVRTSSSTESGAEVGRFCEVIGYTDAGDFAPIVVAERVISLGKGQMPPPARPTWKELINGNMDVQWVELQGLVTAVQSNGLALLLPEGELNIEAQGCPESQLRTFEKSVVRIRGVLFAVWNTNRTVQLGRLMMRNTIVDVDVPAPRDPFDEALKSWSELYQFDSRATAFQRVKVRGTAIYADSRQVFLMDKARGIRVSPVEPADVHFGEEIEVVGYPDIAGPAPLLREAIVRRTGAKTNPQPRVLDGSGLIQENVDATLVRISAKLMGLHLEQDSRVLEMSVGGHLFLVRIPAKMETASLRFGSQLALTGVYVAKAATGSEGSKSTGFELLLSSPSQLTVLSQPSWWTPQRLLIMVGLLLVILTLVAVWISQLQRLVEYRTRQLQREIREPEAAERERALETERSRIARDLHDDLGSSLTEIGVLASKGQRLGAVQDLTTLFRSITAKARELVTALDIIVWAVNPEDNSLESVADYLSDFAGEYLSHSGVACRFNIPVALPPIVLDGRLRHGLLLAVKETLNNVERHAHASEVEFRIAFAEDQFEIIVSDNGRGFDTGKNHGGNGLKNLTFRLSKLGGRYRVESAVGKGTTVTIGLRVSPRNGTKPANGEA
jgi:signal transduction histidine kinase